MKKLLFTAIIMMFAFNVQAQTLKLGAKAGMVFNADKGAINTATEAYHEKGKGSMGFQGGLLAKVGFAGFYVQPELLYTQYKNEFKDATGKSFDLTKKRIDIPVNIGKSFAMGLVHAQLGPVFSYYLEDGNTYHNVINAERDEFNMGFQLGTGVNYKNLLVDLRYEFGLGKTVSKWSGFEVESRPKLLHVSVGYLF